MLIGIDHLGKDVEEVPEATNATTPLKEEFFNSPFFESYLSSDRFHHSKKGCDIQMIKTSMGQRGCEGVIVNRVCHTHSRLCSKSGWEIGWYGGTSSKGNVINCQSCGRMVISNNFNVRYCKECRPKISKILRDKNYLIYKEKHKNRIYKTTTC
jgi:hypothetical protein